jgi:hypothetical protein
MAWYLTNWNLEGAKGDVAVVVPVKSGEGGSVGLQLLKVHGTLLGAEAPVHNMLTMQIWTSRLDILQGHSKYHDLNIEVRKLPQTPQNSLFFHVRDVRHIQALTIHTEQSYRAAGTGEATVIPTDGSSH